MKKMVVVHTLPVFLFLFVFHPAKGQQDLFKDLFESEEPVFHTSISPGYDSGSVQVIFYFTHSKLDELDASVWVKDQGTTMAGERAKRLAGVSHPIRNREPDTVTIRNLQNLHFFTIGVDYRKPNALSRKFNSTVLKGSYRYEYTPPESVTALRQPRPPAGSPPVQQARSPLMEADPCREPDITVWVEPAGYCDENDRPAILLQANNFQEERWAFLVELRTESGPWRTQHIDAEIQAVFGRTIRQESLCTLKPGLYYARVLAWGPGCKNPVIRNISSPIAIADINPQAYTYQPEQTVKSPTRQRSSNILPDSCSVEGQALLVGNKIIGTLELSAYSPCGAYNPYAEVRYIHPGYRDQSVNPVLLAPGRASSFEFLLDSRDLSRNVHPVQVIVYTRPVPGGEGIALSSFWLRTTEQRQATAYEDPRQWSAPTPPSPPARSTGNSQPREYNRVDTRSDNGEASTSYYNSTAQDQNDYASSIDENMMEEHFDTVGVRASDPNCTQIQNLKLYYHRAEPEKPVFISWLNPRCCQQKGCTYTVWVGPSPDKLRLLVEGNKPGATISELLQEQQPDDSYYEVVVDTDNGKRKAGYVLGEGAIYGYEAIIAYRDQFDPPDSDPIIGQVRNAGQVPEESEIQNGEADPAGKEVSSRGLGTPVNNNRSTGFSWNNQNPTTLPAARSQKTVLKNTTAEVKTPTLPLSRFDACRYRRETKLENDQPVETGREVVFSYDHSRQGYQYTLYHQPEGSNDWGIAPGTEELQSSSTFRFQAGPNHSGKYLILAYAPEKGWGCLSSPVKEAMNLNVAGAE